MLKSFLKDETGAELAEAKLIRAAVDITGFGLLGHLASMCRASGVSAEIFADRVPAIAAEVFDLIARDCIPGGSRDNFEPANKFVDWNKTPPLERILLSDAQTSGGLLMAVDPGESKKVLALLRRHRTPCVALIGKIVPRRKRLICISQ